MNYYDLLGISPHSSKKEIDDAYKALLLKHSKRGSIEDWNENAENEKLYQIEVAYSVLSIDWKRAEYDNLLESLGAFGSDKAVVSNTESISLAKNDKEDQEKLQKIYSTIFMNSGKNPQKYLLKTVEMTAIFLAALYVLIVTSDEPKTPGTVGPEPAVTAAVEPIAKAEVEPPVTAKAEPPVAAEVEQPFTAKVEPPVAVEVEQPVTAKVEPPVAVEVEQPVTVKEEPTVAVEVEPAATVEEESTFKPWEFQIGYSCVFDDFSVDERIAPFNIKTADTGIDYFIKLEDNITNKAVMTFYVIGGENFETTVPLGNYTLKYATGEEWYGAEYLFGPDTQYYYSSDIFDFTEDSNGVSGWTITLIKQQGGNLSTYSMDPSKW